MLTRRAFVASLGGVVGVAARPAAGDVPEARRYRCFDARSAAFFVAACERIIPETATSPGATSAEIARYIDDQLSGPWGQGIALQRSGPWQTGTPVARHPATSNPARYFIRAARAIQDRCGGGFERLPSSSQRQLLRALQARSIDLDGVPSRHFLDALCTLAMEGYFSHPKHGLTRDRIEWPTSGYPGAHAADCRQLG